MGGVWGAAAACTAEQVVLRWHGSKQEPCAFLGERGSMRTLSLSIMASCVRHSKQYSGFGMQSAGGPRRQGQ